MDRDKVNAIGCIIFLSPFDIIYNKIEWIIVIFVGATQITDEIIT